MIPRFSVTLNCILIGGIIFFWGGVVIFSALLIFLIHLLAVCLFLSHIKSSYQSTSIKIYFSGKSESHKTESHTENYNCFILIIKFLRSVNHKMYIFFLK